MGVLKEGISASLVVRAAFLPQLRVFHHGRQRCYPLKYRTVAEIRWPSLGEDSTESEETADDVGEKPH